MKVHIVLMLIFISTILGCTSQQRPPTSPLTPPEQWSKTIIQIGWLPTIAIIGCAVSIMAFINGSKSALGAFAGCAVALSLSLATVKFATIIAITGGIGSVVVFCYSVFVKNRALKEIVDGGQEIKEQISTGYFNKERAKEIVNMCFETFQSSTTKQIVKEIKNGINNSNGN